MNEDHLKLKNINLIVSNKIDRNILDSVWRNKICKRENKGRKNDKTRRQTANSELVS